MSLLQEFNKLSFKDEQEENDFMGYCADIMSNKLAGPVPYKHIVIPEKNVRAFVLLTFFF